MTHVLQVQWHCVTSHDVRVGPAEVKLVRERRADVDVLDASAALGEASGEWEAGRQGGPSGGERNAISDEKCNA